MTLATQSNVIRMAVASVASSGLGTATLSTSAPSGYIALTSANDGQVFNCTFMEGAAGSETAREVDTQCTFSWNSGTPTMTRGTLESTTAGGSTRITLSSAGFVEVTMPASLISRLESGAAPTITYATAVPFTQSGQMPQQTVAGAIAFTINSAGALDGVQVTLDLLADGTHAPTFTGFREWDGSSGYVNTANVRNCITFFRRSGIYYYSVNQQVGAAADPVAATGITFSGPTSGVVGTASSNFTVGVTPGGSFVSGTNIVTPGDASNGGTFTPTTVSLTGTGPSGTFTYTPASTGVKTLSVTNNGGLSNPANISYTSNASPTVPGAPTIGTATAGDASASVPFTAPGSNGGATITGYTATSTPGGITGTLSGAGSGAISVTGLTNGTSYTFTVHATNSVGNSAESSASNSVTPAATGASFIRKSAQLGSPTETGDGTVGYTYTGGGGSDVVKFGTVPLDDGDYVSIQMGATGTNGPIFVVLASDSPSTWAIGSAYKGVWPQSGGLLVEMNGGALGSLGTFAFNDRIRLRRAGTSLVLEQSADDGASWPTTLKTWAGLTFGTGGGYNVVQCILYGDCIKPKGLGIT